MPPSAGEQRSFSSFSAQSAPTRRVSSAGSETCPHPGKTEAYLNISGACTLSQPYASDGTSIRAVGTRAYPSVLESHMSRYVNK